MPSVLLPSAGVGDVRARAVSLLEENTQTATLNGVRYRFSVPSIEAYPFQWFWDSCFHAIVWAGQDPERAADELRGLLAWQEPSGLIPHVVFWDRRRISPLMWHYLESRGPLHWLPLTGRPVTTAGIQPPVLAQAVEHLAGAGVDGGFVGAALPALER